MKRIVIAVGMACLIAGVGGCSWKDKWQLARPVVVPMQGVVLFNGNPLADVVMTLYPVTGQHSAYGRTNASGEFRLTTFEPNDGVVPGSYQVTAKLFKVDYEPHPTDPQAPPLYHAEQSLIPESYNDIKTSGLTAEVYESVNQDLKFELQGEPGKLRVIVARRGS